MLGQMASIGEGSSLLYRPPSLKIVQDMGLSHARDQRCSNLRKTDRLWRPRKEKAPSLAAPARQNAAPDQKVCRLRKVWV